MLIKEQFSFFDKKTKTVILATYTSQLFYFKLNPKTQNIFLIKLHVYILNQFLSLQNFFTQYRYYVYNVYIYSTLKLVFKGKGYRVRKFKKHPKYTFHFGRSHWTKLYFNINSIISRRFSKQKFLFLSKFRLIFKNLNYCLKTVKKINHYTKRGLRVKHQIIHKRFGKVSQVTSSIF